MSQANVGVETSENMPQMQPDLLIAVGSNMASEVGGPEIAVSTSVRMLAEAGAVIRAESRLFRTPAFPPSSGPDYVNAALRVAADWSVTEALEHLHRIEAEMGRTRSVRWGQRVIDLDLLGAGDCVHPSRDTVARWMALPADAQRTATPDHLILPHPRLHERAFVLVPLADVAPDWTHPMTGRCVAQMCAALPAAERAAIVPLQ